MDEPSGAVVWKTVPTMFRGWALEDTQLPVAVRVIVGHKHTFNARLGQPRPDVPLNLNEPQAPKNCGWKRTIDLSGWRRRRVRVRVVVEGETGGRTVLIDRVLRLRGGDFAGDVEVSAYGDDTAGNCLVVRGWAVIAGRLPTRVEVQVNGQTVGRARLRLRHSSVEALDLRAGQLAGFEYRGPLRSDHDEPVEVGVTVTAVDGSQFRMQAKSVQMIHPVTGWDDATRALVLRSRTSRAVALSSFAESPPERSSAPRILVFTHHLGLGGGQLYLQELLRQIVPLLEHCTVVSPTDGVLRTELEDLGIDVVVTGDRMARDIDTYEGQIRELTMFIRGSRCNIVLLNTLGVWPAADAAQRAAIPTLWAIHESLDLADWLGQVHGIGDCYAYNADRLVASLDRASYLVFEAHATSELFSRHTGNTNRLVIPYGVDVDAIETYARSVDRTAARRRQQIPEDVTLLVMVGTVEERKSHACLAEAFAEIAADRPEAALVMIGDAPVPYSASLHRLLKLADLGPRLRLLPVTPNIWDWYLMADVLVSVSDIESLPRSMLEAMAFGVPVLSTDVFGVPEVIDDGRNGWLLPARDMSCLSAALQRVLSLSPDARKAVGDAARERVRLEHRSSNYGRAYAELMRNLAPLGTPSPTGDERGADARGS